MHKCLVCGGNILFGPNIVKDPKTDAFERKITSHRFGFCENFCNRYEEVNGKLAQSVLAPVRI